MNTFLLEIYSEEIPAKMQTPMREKIAKLVSQELNIAVQHSVFIAMCRVVIASQNLPETIRAETIRGPKINAPSQAIEGFLTKYNINKSNLTAQQEYYIYQPQDVSIIQFLQNKIPQIIKQISQLWSNRMHWNNTKEEWIRPIRSILCMLNEQKINFSYSGVHSSNYTFGSKQSLYNISNYLANGRMHITNASEYHKQFASYFQTKTHIQLQLQQHYKELNANNAVDENLLDEVSGLCENPKVLQGTIPQQYMNIPHCILESTMKINQRYFPIYKPDGSLLNRFLFVADNVSQNNQQCIIDGNAKVLNARLADAQYFYNEDVKTFGNITIEDAEKWLEKMPFHTQLGSMYHKTQRIEYIFHKIANKNISDAKNIIPFIKLDLATKVVQEFPELQGKIGAEYYKRFWHNKPDDHYVISDQYGTFIRKELSLSQRLILIANALEHIACQFTIGNKPTSSGDPFAVRRYGNNLVNWTLSNIYENTINLDLSAESLSCILPAEIATHANEIATFLSERILRCKQN